MQYKIMRWHEQICRNVESIMNDVSAAFIKKIERNGTLLVSYFRLLSNRPTLIMLCDLRCR